MIVQNLIWSIALAGIGLVTLGCLYIVINASRPADAEAVSRSQGRIGSTRRWLFWILVLVFVGVGYGTLLRHFPIPRQSADLQAAQVVDVVGHQWYWEMRRQGGAADAPLTLETGSPVEFRVTSADVNHGFAIYAPNEHIVIQTQAMPEYTNRMLYTFSEPGTYRVMCLEYCGIGHAPMVAEFVVTAPTGG